MFVIMSAADSSLLDRLRQFFRRSRVHSRSQHAQDTRLTAADSKLRDLERIVKILEWQTLPHTHPQDEPSDHS